MKIAIIFGGMSNEHEVSINSANSIIKNLNKKKYNVTLIYIDKKGTWYKNKELNYKIPIDIKEWKKIENVIDELKQLNVIFPVLHGKYGEDGAIQGLLELIQIPYVGCEILPSSIAMDKIYTKFILEKAKIKQAKYQYIRKEKNNFILIDKELNETKTSLDKIIDIIETNLKYPIFIKPSNSGSSIGISKAKNKEELREGILLASKTDNKIIIEQNIIGREIECAILGNNEIKTSCLGEIKTISDFYNYESKYNDTSSKLIIPAKLNKKLTEKTKEIAKKAFKAISGKGLARVDFFINEEKEEIYLNEINTMPGFTITSMYPKLWEESGIKYSELLDTLIELAIEKKK